MARASGQKEDDWSPNPESIVFTMTILAFAAPVAFAIDPATSGEVRLTVIALTWHVLLGEGYIIFSPLPFTSVTLFPIVFFKLGFAHQLYRCYQGLVSKTRTITMGVLSELPIFLFMALTYLPAVGTPYVDYLSMIGPIPHLLLFGLIILFLAPPVEPRQWIEEISAPPKW
ncbi:MAG: hypothetical protein ACXABV_04305 [Candidatus Thorarchaeota archaeon]|jgi:hypothetical protein